MIAVLKRTPVIWGLFIAQLLIFPCFALFSDAVGGRYLDTITTGEGCRALIAAMTQAQRNAHFWITVLLDTAYPLLRAIRATCGLAGAGDHHCRPDREHGAGAGAVWRGGCA